MEGNEGGGDNPPISNKRPRVEVRGDDPEADFGVGGGGERNDTYLPFHKPNYKRLYTENSVNTEFKVFVEANKDSLPNKSTIYLNHIFATEVKGVTAIQRVNSSKISVIFKQYNTANNFNINNSSFVKKYEKTGIINFVPANIFNKDLYSRLSSIYEIIAIRKFTKKVGHEYTNKFLKIYHHYNNVSSSANICNGKQNCSICGGEHLYKEWDKPTDICCVNCSGPHLAIKMKKIMEKNTEITYASATSTKQVNNNDFPPLPTSNPHVYHYRRVRKCFKENL